MHWIWAFVLKATSLPVKIIPSLQIPAEKKTICWEISVFDIWILFYVTYHE